MLAENEHIYEVSYVMKKGEFPLITHIRATSEEDATQKILEQRKAAKVLEVFPLNK